ncbi:putative chorismate--pyruvate lyase [Pasteurella canis]|uniref:Probable chorismate pyruvate-lyase n=1 Tax=Pasteurella canis TaxID=753 RepID=A0A379ETF4_9PAST|nr:chorismate lyase [Pasteurella canis]SUC09344.1 putative chorismate--pyruvate lyase [Pasteurella canis]
MHKYSKCLQEANWLFFDKSHTLQPPLNIQKWLLLSSSLTEQLRLHFGSVKVNVLSEYWLNNVAESERHLFTEYKRFWCREVLLYTQNKPLIFARTLMPDHFLLQHLELQQLGNRALGEWLFNQRNRQRKTSQWAKIEEFQYETYARRTLIEVNTSPIMVAELFLEPQIFTEEIHG